MTTEDQMLDAMRTRIGQCIINPNQELKPGEWMLAFGISPANLRRRVIYMADIWGDAIIGMGRDQRTTLARIWRCQDRAAKAEQQKMSANKVASVTKPSISTR